MSSICFDPEGSSSGRRLDMQLWYGTFTCISSIEHTLLPTRLFLPMHVRQIIPHLYVQPSSCRWTFGFGTCGRQHKL